jgi:hypothetical protein
MLVVEAACLGIVSYHCHPNKITEHWVWVNQKIHTIITLGLGKLGDPRYNFDPLLASKTCILS